MKKLESFLGLDSIFIFGDSSSKKTNKRLKEIFTFEMEGEFYIPKAIKFSLRANNSLNMLKTLTFQAYQNLEEKQHLLNVGVEVEAPQPETSPQTLTHFLIFLTNALNIAKKYK